MQQQRRTAARPEADTRAVEEARAMFARAEEAWRRQVEGEDADVSTPRGGLVRGALLGLAIAAIVFLLFHHLAQLN
jgi:hypothetical protein